MKESSLSNMMKLTSRDKTNSHLKMPSNTSSHIAPNPRHSQRRLPTYRRHRFLWSLLILPPSILVICSSLSQVTCKPNESHRTDIGNNLRLGKPLAPANSQSPISTSTTTTTTSTSTTQDDQTIISSNNMPRNSPEYQNSSQLSSFQCPEQFGYYTDTKDCTKYYVCVFGEVIHESCTGGLRFSRELQTCDWPRNVDCPQGSQVDIQENGTTSTTTSSSQLDRTETEIRQNSVSTSTSLSGIVRQNSDAKSGGHEDPSSLHRIRDNIGASERSMGHKNPHLSMVFADEGSDPQQPNFDEAISPVITPDGSIHLHDGSGGTFGLTPNQQPSDQPQARPQQGSGSVDIFVRPLNVAPDEQQLRLKLNNPRSQSMPDKRVSFSSPSSRALGETQTPRISHVTSHDHAHNSGSQHHHPQSATTTNLQDDDQPFNLEESNSDTSEDGLIGEDEASGDGADSMSAQADRESGDDQESSTGGTTSSPTESGPPTYPRSSSNGPSTITTSGYIPPVSPSERQHLPTTSQLLTINNRPIEDSSSRQTFKPILAPSPTALMSTTPNGQKVSSTGNNQNRPIKQHQRESLIHQLEMIENPMGHRHMTLSNGAHSRQNITSIHQHDRFQPQQNIRPSRMSNPQQLQQPQAVAFFPIQGQSTSISNGNSNNKKPQIMQNFNLNDPKLARSQPPTSQQHLRPQTSTLESSSMSTQALGGIRSQGGLAPHQPFGLNADSGSTNRPRSHTMVVSEASGIGIEPQGEPELRGISRETVGLNQIPLTSNQRRPRPPKRQQIPTSSNSFPTTPARSRQNPLTASLQAITSTTMQMHNMNQFHQLSANMMTTTQPTTNTFFPILNSPDLSEPEDPPVSDSPIRPSSQSNGRQQKQPQVSFRLVSQSQPSTMSPRRPGNNLNHDNPTSTFFTSPATPSSNANMNPMNRPQPQQPQNQLNSDTSANINNSNNNNYPRRVTASHIGNENVEGNNISINSQGETQTQNSLAANSINANDQHLNHVSSISTGNSNSNNHDRAFSISPSSSIPLSQPSPGSSTPRESTTSVSGLEAGVGQPFGAIDYDFDILNENSTERRPTPPSSILANPNTINGGSIARNQTFFTPNSQNTGRNANSNRSARLQQPAIDISDEDDSIGNLNHGDPGSRQSGVDQPRSRSNSQQSSSQAQMVPSSSTTGSTSLGSTNKKPRPSNKKIVVNHEQAIANTRASTEPARRPEAIFSTPMALQTATKCDNRICQLPDCKCGDTLTPAGLDPKVIPQVVLLTFDDAVNDLNWEIYEELFNGRSNPNGCPILATFYVSHEWTDYGQVQTLYSRGHEMASHSITHSFGEKFSKSQWFKEINGQREILNMYGGVKMNDVRGMRAPFLQVGGNKMFEMLYDANFTYDSSMPIFENSPPLWPYTLDYQLSHECMITPCPTKSFPGVWEVGMTMWVDLRGGRCSMGDACSNPADEDGVYEMLMKNFNRHYKSNRAPFGLFYHSAWFNTAHHRRGFLRFLTTVNSMPDVFFVTNWQMLQWMRKPTPMSEITTFEPWQCQPNHDRPPPCFHPSVCNVKSEHGK